MQGPGTRRATLRLGARELRRLQQIVAAVVCLLLYIVLRPYFIGLVETRDFQTCQSNLLRIGKAIRLYTDDWDATLPVASNWMDATITSMAASTGSGFKVESYFRCPRDHSGGVSSYIYNAACSGLAVTVRQLDAETQERRRKLGRLERAAIVVEHHGAARNTSMPMWDWDDVRETMTRPHNMPLHTGGAILGDLSPAWRTDEQLAALAGRGF